MIKRQLSLDDSHHILLSDLLYRSGQKLTVIVMAEDELQQRQQKWKKFFKELQSLPVAQDLTDEDIAREIDIYRDSRSQSVTKGCDSKLGDW